MALVLVFLFIVSWELYLRHKGYHTDYDDGPELWANSRAMVYEPSDKATVFIGSSRIKYDLDIPTWQRLTGTHAIQLAMTGSSPRLMLSDLAADTAFKGRLIVDITEILFYTGHNDFKPAGGISYYKQRTLSQKASFQLGLPLESSFVLLNSGRFSINGLLGGLHVPDRPGVFPFLDFPPGFEYTAFDRQNSMTPEFLADTNQINQVRGIWGMIGKISSKEGPPIHGKALDSFLLAVKADVDRIKARGGQVIFTRTPSSGPFAIGESKGFPRSDYWDKLLAVTGCKGIHYADDPATAHLICPEFSHLRPKDAIIYTKALCSALNSHL